MRGGWTVQLNLWPLCFRITIFKDEINTLLLMNTISIYPYENNNEVYNKTL
jgi:hypothetical protein